MTLRYHAHVYMYILLDKGVLKSYTQKVLFWSPKPNQVETFKSTITTLERPILPQ